MKVAFLGIGLMGLAMAKRLINANIPVVAYNRTPAKLAPLQEIGAEITTDAAEAIKISDCIILMLSNAAAIEEVVLSPNIRQELTGKTIIQMGTISPSQSINIREQIIPWGGEYLEAPVLGSIPEAETGKLIVMVGASNQQFEQWQNLLKNFSPEPLFIGEVGTAAALKLALNQLISALTSGFALSLGLVQRQGVNVELFMQILRQSALYAPTFDKKLSRMLDRNYANPNFPTKHLLKDTKLFIDEAKLSGLNTSSSEGVLNILEKAVTMNLADVDYSALFSAINPEDIIAEDR